MWDGAGEFIPSLAEGGGGGEDDDGNARGEGGGGGGGAGPATAAAAEGCEDDATPTPDVDGSNSNSSSSSPRSSCADDLDDESSLRDLADVTFPGGDDDEEDDDGASASSSDEQLFPTTTVVVDSGGGKKSPAQLEEDARRRDLLLGYDEDAIRTAFRVSVDAFYGSNAGAAAAAADGIRPELREVEGPRPMDATGDDEDDDVQDEPPDGDLVHGRLEFRSSPPPTSTSTSCTPAPGPATVVPHRDGAGGNNSKRWKPSELTLPGWAVTKADAIRYKAGASFNINAGLVDAGDERSGSSGGGRTMREEGVGM